MKKVTLKIIVDDRSSSVEEDARESLARLAKLDLQRGKITPVGIAHYSAQHPIFCDECGATYWSQDPHSYFHAGCTGKKKEIGF